MRSDSGVTSFERILGLLTVRQYLYPHETVQAALVQSLGVTHASEVLRAEGVDGESAIGRLAHKDLLRLARRLTTSRTGNVYDPATPQQMVA